MHLRHFMVLVLISISVTAFAETITVTNPSAAKASVGKARDAKIVAAEKAGALATLKAIDDMAKTSGVAKVVAEINKGRAGAFGKSMPKGHFYLSLCEFKTADSAVFVAHGTNQAFVGFEVPSLDIFQDNTGWTYAKDLFAQAKGKRAFDGVMEGIVWSDPEWQKGKKAQMAAYNKVAEYGGKLYWTYYAVWIEE